MRKKWLLLVPCAGLALAALLIRAGVEDARQAVIRATLDAVNRRVERILAQAG